MGICRHQSDWRQIGTCRKGCETWTTSERVKNTEGLLNGLNRVMIVHLPLLYVLWIHLNEIKVNKGNEMSGILILPHAFRTQRLEY